MRELTCLAIGVVFVLACVGMTNQAVETDEDKQHTNQMVEESFDLVWDGDTTSTIEWSFSEEPTTWAWHDHFDCPWVIQARDNVGMILDTIQWMPPEGTNRVELKYECRDELAPYIEGSPGLILYNGSTTEPAP